MGARIYGPVEVGASVEVRPTSTGDWDEWTGAVGVIREMHPGGDCLVELVGGEEVWVVRRRLRPTYWESA